MTNKYSTREASRIVEDQKFGDNAYVQNAQNNAPSAIRKVTVSLTTGNDDGNLFKVGFPFKCVYVDSATDSSTEILMKPFSDSMNNDYIPLRKNAVLTFDRSINECYLKWSAQTGSEITLYFLTDAKFETGNTLTEVASSVDGNVITPEADLVLNMTPVELMPQDLERKIMNIYASADWEMSNSAQVNWFPVSSGYWKISNTAQVYARSSSGAVIKKLGEY